MQYIFTSSYLANYLQIMKFILDIIVGQIICASRKCGQKFATLTKPQLLLLFIIEGFFQLKSKQISFIF